MCDNIDQQEIYLKIYRNGRDVLMAVCDCDLLGKKFVEGQLQVEICQEFFGDRKASIEEFERALDGATIANFVGKCAVRHAIRLGYVDENKILVIDGVPCAQMVRM